MKEKRRVLKKKEHKITTPIWLESKYLFRMTKEISYKNFRSWQVWQTSPIPEENTLLWIDYQIHFYIFPIFFAAYDYEHICISYASIHIYYFVCIHTFIVFSTMEKAKMIWCFFNLVDENLLLSIVEIKHGNTHRSLQFCSTATGLSLPTEEWGILISSVLCNSYCTHPHILQMYL